MKNYISGLKSLYKISFESSDRIHTTDKIIFSEENDVEDNRKVIQTERKQMEKRVFQLMVTILGIPSISNGI